MSVTGAGALTAIVAVAVVAVAAADVVAGFLFILFLNSPSFGFFLFRFWFSHASACGTLPQGARA